MANYSSIKATIDANIKQNNNQEITGNILNSVLNEMIDSLGAGYLFKGIASTSTNPGSPDEKVFYIAGTTGTYTYFGNFTATENELTIFYFDTAWHKSSAQISTVHPVDVEDTDPGSFADLEITDEQGNKLAEFKGGQIRVKNFNSQNIGESDLPEFLETDDYPAGQLVRKEGKIYLFNTDHQAGSWDDSEVTLVTLISLNPAIEMEGNEDIDLDIADINGYSILRLAGGHIITKNFDSSKSNRSAILAERLKGKKIAVIGDSISTYQGWLPSDSAGYDGASYAYYYPRGNVNSPALTWWYKMALQIGINPSTDLNMCSWSGSRVSCSGNVRSDSTSSAAPGCSTRRISDLAIKGWNPDIVIVFISCNDWANNVSVGSWAVSDAIPAEGIITELRAAYALMLNKIHSSYPSAKIFCCTNLDDLYRDSAAGWPSNNGNGVTTYQWNQNIREIAEAFGGEVIDLHSCGINYSNIASYAVDAGLHPNVAGMDLIAQKMVNELTIKY